MSFAIGKLLIYGSSGVCRLLDIREEKIAGETRRYYILEPFYDKNSTVYVPCDNEMLVSKMRELVEKNAAKALLVDDDGERTEWVEGDKPRRERFSLIIDSGDRTQIIRLARTLTEKRRECESEGRKFHACDEHMLTRAHKVLCDELSIVLDISREDVLSAIYKKA